MDIPKSGQPLYKAVHTYSGTSDNGTLRSGQPLYNRQTASPIMHTVHTFLPSKKGQTLNDGDKVILLKSSLFRVFLLYFGLSGIVRCAVYLVCKLCDVGPSSWE